MGGKIRGHALRLGREFWGHWATKPDVFNEGEMLSWCRAWPTLLLWLSPTLGHKSWCQPHPGQWDSKCPHSYSWWQPDLVTRSLDNHTPITVLLSLSPWADILWDMACFNNLFLLEVAIATYRVFTFLYKPAADAHTGNVLDFLIHPLHLSVHNNANTQSFLAWEPLIPSDQDNRRHFGHCAFGGRTEGESVHVRNHKSFTMKNTKNF